MIQRKNKSSYAKSRTTRKQAPSQRIDRNQKRGVCTLIINRLVLLESNCRMFSIRLVALSILWLIRVIWESMEWEGSTAGLRIKNLISISRKKCQEITICSTRSTLIMIQASSSLQNLKTRASPRTPRVIAR